MNHGRIHTFYSLTEVIVCFSGCFDSIEKVLFPYFIRGSCFQMSYLSCGTKLILSLFQQQDQCQSRCR